MQEVRAHRVQPSPPLNHLNTFSYSKTISPKVAALNVTHSICVVGLALVINYLMTASVELLKTPHVS